MRSLIALLVFIVLFDNALALEHKPGAGKVHVIAALKGTDR